MWNIAIAVILLSIIVIIGSIFEKSKLPLSIFLVLTGIVLSPFIHWPLIEMHPHLVLYIFLPLLLFEISAKTSIRDFKSNLKPILFMSIGHVLFMTVLIASVLHYAVPAIGWPLAFIIGSVLAPPDDVAIANIAQKVKLPNKIISILEGEAMLNDAAALVLLRFSVIAWVTHEFSLNMAAMQFMVIMIGETLYGILLGNFLGKIRLYIKDPMLYITSTLVTPFIAFLPAELLGGTGVISTVVTGFILGNYYAQQLKPELRTLYYAVWPAIAFILQSVLFLLVGVNINVIYHSVSMVPTSDMVKFVGLVSLCVVFGRFAWIYTGTYLSRLFPRAGKKQKPVPWQYPFIMSWSGIRGGISLAAALIVPNLPTHVDNLMARDFVTFLVFSVIVVTLVLQGLSLPWLIKKTNINQFTHEEKHKERSSEIVTRLTMIDAALAWLRDTAIESDNNKAVLDEIYENIDHYEKLKARLNRKLSQHQKQTMVEEFIINTEMNFYTQTLEIERDVLIKLWKDDKISLQIRNNLLVELDFRSNAQRYK